MSELVNCDMCGRDTTNKCRISRRCFGGVRQGGSDRKTPSWGEILYGDVSTREDDVGQEVRDALDEMVN